MDGFFYRIFIETLNRHGSVLLQRNFIIVIVAIDSRAKYGDQHLFEDKILIQDGKKLEINYFSFFSIV